MMIEEFVKLTGFTPDRDYYTKVIEKDYMNSTLEKKEWCEQWLANGGIQKAYDAMKSEVDVYKKTVECTVKEYRSLRDDYDKLLAEKNDLLEERNDTLKNFDSSKKAIEEIIDKIYYLYKQLLREKDDLSVLITKLIEVKLLQTNNHEN